MNAGRSLARRRDRDDDDDDYYDDRPRRSKKSRQADDAARRMTMGCIFGAVVIPLAIIFLIFVIVAIRIREAQRHGEGPFAQRPRDEDPPPQPPIEQPPQPPPPNKMPANIGADGFARTDVVGGAFDPQFEDRAPAGGILIGLELAVVDNNSIKTVRPIYLLNGKEVRGGQLGGVNPNAVLKAKQGYAVSSLNVNAGLWIDGMSVTFARLANGRLDLNDSYQSNYLGGNGGGRSVHGGNGMNVVGIACKSSNNNCTGIGAILK